MNNLWRPVFQSLVLAASWSISLAQADISLPPLLSDGAILQRDQAIPIWGRASADADVQVTLGNVQQRVKANASGRWQAEFSALPAGTALTLTISDGESQIRVEDLLMGDVWVCSGQSNMEWPMRNTQNYENALRAADNPSIRHFKVPLSWSMEASDRLAGGAWELATASTIGNFSAVAYYFAEQVQQTTGVPIGLISSNWGGSNIEAWMSPQALRRTPANTAETIQAQIKEKQALSQTTKALLARWPSALVEEITDADADWSGPQVDTRDWLSIQAPGLWESQGLSSVDGVIWYRKLIVLDAEEAASDALLGLGRIDDHDTTWVNGVRVGTTQAYDQLREYRVPADALRAGLNSIAIRVEDTGGGGGIYSDSALLFIRTSKEQKSLAGAWQIKADQVILNPLDNMNHVPTALYNKMLHPLFRIPVKGVLWYQGESNANSIAQARNYAEQFRRLIEDWRVRWGRPELPFYWVQLANFNSGGDSDAGSPWAILRASQSEALSLPHTGQAITIDVGDPDDIHPTDKQTVGRRLALIALNKSYGQKNVHHTGPTLRSAVWQDNRLVLQFDAPQGLVVRGEDQAIAGFEVAGVDNQFIPVVGEVVGHTVVINPPNSEKPTIIRYAWDDNPQHANLMDGSGLPAAPFWHVISE